MVVWKSYWRPTDLAKPPITVWSLDPVISQGGCALGTVHWALGTVHWALRPFTGKAEQFDPFTGKAEQLRAGIIWYYSALGKQSCIICSPERPFTGAQGPRCSACKNTAMKTRVCIIYIVYLFTLCSRTHIGRAELWRESCEEESIYNKLYKVYIDNCDLVPYSAWESVFVQMWTQERVDIGKALHCAQSISYERVSCARHVNHVSTYTKYIIHVCNTCKVHVRCIERNPSDVSGYHVQATTCSCFITTPVSISIWQPLALRISGYQDIRPGKNEDIGGMRLWGYQAIMRSGEYEKIMKWREFGPKWHRSPKLG